MIGLEKKEATMAFLRNPGPTDPNHRCEGVILFSATNCNPNGDPDDGGKPRQDPETGHGLVTNVCIKRHFRDTLPHVVDGRPGFKVYVQSKTILDHALSAAYKELGIKPAQPPKGRKKKGEGEEKKGDDPAEAAAGEGAETVQEQDPATLEKVRTFMCKTYYDIRTFGAVLASKMANGGQVRGPVQIDYANSIEPVLAVADSITRCALQTDREAETNKMTQTFGDRPRIPFGLFQASFYFSPSFARRTGFSSEDLKVFWETFSMLFEFTRSSGRAAIGMERIVVFEHDNPLGRTHAHRLIGLMTGVNKDGLPRIRRKEGVKVARAFSDYIVPTKEEIEAGIRDLGTQGVTVHDLL
jgi:CRISPR-associated protein Csd2